MLIDALGALARRYGELWPKELWHRVQTPSKSHQQGDLQKSLVVSPIIRLVIAESDTPHF